MIYKLKNGREVESIPIGRSSIKIGEQNNYLTICDRGPDSGSSRGANVICKCQCGQYTILKLNAFRNGTTKSCGCYAKKVQQENGRKVGELSNKKDYTKIKNNYYTFIKQLEEKDNSNGFYWDVQCNKCGSHYKAVPAQLISDTRPKGTNPCSCWKRVSKGVLKIINLLEQNNITFEQEKTFNSCLSPNGNLMKFDFWIPKSKYLIEYDGEQHFSVQFFPKGSKEGEDKLKNQQKYDIIKNEWCKNNNISLIRIPYTHYKELNINDLLLETSSFIQE